MWAGAFTSSTGTWMQKLAQSWLVLQISNSPFLLGLDSFLGEIPIFLFSILGGAVADRMDRRKLLLASQIVQMSCAFGLAGLIALGRVQVWHILALSFIVGLAQAFGGPAYAALVPTLVRPEDLSNAIALNSIQFNLARVVGPMLGGLALTTLGASWCFSLNGVSFLAVIASLLMLSRRYVRVATSESLFRSVKRGLGFVRRTEAMPSLIALSFCTTMLGIPVVVFLPVFAKDVFHQGPSTFTLLLSISGAGSVFGALAVAAMGHIERKGRISLLMLTGLGVTISLFAISRNLAWSCIFLFLSGAALVAVFALVTSLVQLLTTDEMRGRVMSVYNVAFRGGMPVGSLLTGSLTPLFSAPGVLACNGLAMTLLGGYFLAVHRRVGRL